MTGLGGTPARELHGIELRSFLSLQLLAARRPLRVCDLVRTLEGDGFVVAGRTSKVVSDSLRWEIARGRVVKVARGVYAIRRIPRTTLRRMQRRVGDVLARPLAPVRIQPLRAPQPLVREDGPWRYRRRYGIMDAPRTPWGHGIPMVETPVVEAGEVTEGLRRQRRRLEQSRRSVRFGPHMV